MPLLSPSYSAGPWTFRRRSYLTLSYVSDLEAVRAVVPAALRVNAGGVVLTQWSSTNAPSLGDYRKAETLVPCFDEGGELVLFAVMACMDSSAPITAGREVFGEVCLCVKGKGQDWEDTIVRRSHSPFK
jgi:acetoacetate decarboxylase